MAFDAVILAGGRSSRLGGVPKAALRYGGETLLNLAVQAAQGAQAVVVVGPVSGTLPADVLTCREEPPFSGPAAAIAAGCKALEQNRLEQGNAEHSAPARVPAPLTLVLACDMPQVRAAVRVLAAAVETPGGPEADGVMALSADGRRQPLIGFYRTTALKRCISEAERLGTLKNASVFSLLASLEVRAVPVPSGSTDDVDTWDDASTLGITGPMPGTDPGGRLGAAQLDSTLEANGENPG